MIFKSDFSNSDFSQSLKIDSKYVLLEHTESRKGLV